MVNLSAEILESTAEIEVITKFTQILRKLKPVIDSTFLLRKMW